MRAKAVYQEVHTTSAFFSDISTNLKLNTLKVVLLHANEITEAKTCTILLLHLIHYNVKECGALYLAYGQSIGFPSME